MVQTTRTERPLIRFAKSVIFTTVAKLILPNRHTGWKEYINQGIEPALYLNPKIHNYGRNRQIKYDNEYRVCANRCFRKQPVRYAE